MAEFTFMKRVNAGRLNAELVTAGFTDSLVNTEDDVKRNIFRSVVRTAMGDPTSIVTAHVYVAPQRPVNRIDALVAKLKSLGINVGDI